MKMLRNISQIRVSYLIKLVAEVTLFAQIISNKSHGPFF
jgi:hypothetical protein